jgi:hypothetical protein
LFRASIFAFRISTTQWFIGVHQRSSFGSAQDGVCGSKLFWWLSSLWLRDGIGQGIVRKVREFFTVAIFDPPPPNFV